MVKLSKETKSKFNKFKDWQNREDDLSIEDLKALDHAFQEAVIFFYQTGNMDQVRYVADCHIGKNKEKFVEYLIQRLPFEYKGESKTSFSVKSGW